MVVDAAVCVDKAHDPLLVEILKGIDAPPGGEGNPRL